MSSDSSHMHLCEKKLFARIIYKFNIHLCKVLLAFTPNEQSTMVTRFTKWHMDFSRILFASRKQSNTNYHKEIDHINRSIIIALPITMVNKIYRETVIMANCMQYPQMMLIKTIKTTARHILTTQTQIQTHAHARTLLKHDA